MEHANVWLKPTTSLFFFFFLLLSNAKMPWNLLVSFAERSLIPVVLGKLSFELFVYFCYRISWAIENAAQNKERKRHCLPEFILLSNSFELRRACQTQAIGLHIDSNTFYIISVPGQVTWNNSSTVSRLTTRCRFFFALLFLVDVRTDED